MSPDLIISVLLLVFFLFWSAYFAAAEAALFSLPSTKVKAYEASSNPKNRLIAHLIREPKNLLVTVFMLNTLVNILIQNTTSHIFESGSWLYKVVLPFILLLFIGEIIPKYIGLINNVKLSNKVAPLIDKLQRYLAPIRKFTISITAPISRALFFFLRKEDDISAEELKHVLKTSQEHGVLTNEEAELVRGYINFQDATVKELMRPREDILYYDVNEPLKKLMYLFVDQECSRIPVCDHSLDKVLGIISAKTFFIHRNRIDSPRKLKHYLFAPLYIPESTPATTLARRFKDTDQVTALVVDEYGSVSGLITREDLVEVVIGDIIDLRDTNKHYSKTGPNEIIASGKLELAVLNEIFGTELVSEYNMITVGGWLTEIAGEIPKNGSSYERGGLSFRVTATEPNKIKRLIIKKIDEKSGGTNP